MTSERVGAIGNDAEADTHDVKWAMQVNYVAAIDWQEVVGPTDDTPV